MSEIADLLAALQRSVDAAKDARASKAKDARQDWVDDGWDLACVHEWTSRPESDTWVCEFCSEER